MRYVLDVKLVEFGVCFGIGVRRVVWEIGVYVLLNEVI